MSAIPRQNARIPQYRLRRVLPNGGIFHLARTVYQPEQTYQVHWHDFSEICWLEHGQALHLINGERQRLMPGTVTWIRPEDAHGFRTIGRHGFVMVNLAFDVAILRHIQNRYVNDPSPWRWTDAKMPMQVALSPDRMAELTTNVEQLSMQRQSHIDLEWFILSLLRLSEPHPSPRESMTQVPPWLDHALTCYVEKGEYEGGPAELADLAGRTMEHLNRTVRACYGQTTTDLINDLRLDHAAKLLRMTGDAIIDVALQSGFNNLGYFYRQFRQKFGDTPRHYRMNMHAMMR